MDIKCYEQEKEKCSSGIEELVNKLGGLRVLFIRERESERKKKIHVIEKGDKKRGIAEEKLKTRVVKNVHW